MDLKEYFKTHPERILFTFFIVLLAFCCWCETKSSFAGGFSGSDVLIFHSPGCGWCMKSMDDFKAAQNQMPGVIHLIDINEESNNEIAQSYDVSAYPTIVKGDGTVYNKKDRKAQSIMDFAKGI
jgi:thiol-disulfide isomerase/thioredoxin